MREVTPQIPTWTLGDRIRKARTIRFMTVAELAAEIDRHAQTVTRWENDFNKPAERDVFAVADVCGVDRAWLLGDAKLR